MALSPLESQFPESSETASPGPPPPDNTIGRYLTQRGQFSSERNRVKPRAFEPPLDRERLVHLLSVFVIDGLAETEIWELGDTYVGRPHGRDILATGELTAKDVRNVDSLELLRDDVPPRHAHIQGWPSGKDERKILAIELAAVARLRIR